MGGKNYEERIKKKRLMVGMVITIIDVKIVGECSKHEGREILKDQKGRVYEDSEISCIECCL